MVDSAFLIRPSRGDLFRSDVARFGVRVRDAMAPLMTVAVQSVTEPGGGIEGEPFSDGYFWDDDTGWIDD